MGEVLSKLGIDTGGLLVYFVNFGIIAAVLTYFLYKPLLKALDDRGAQVKNNLDEAERLRKQFEAEREARERENRLMVEKMQSEVAAARQAAESKAQELIAEAEERKKQLMADARAQIELLKAGLQAEVESEILARMERTIMDVLQNRVPKDVLEKSIRESWKSMEDEF